MSYESLTEECLLQPECAQLQLTSLVVKLSSLLHLSNAPMASSSGLIFELNILLSIVWRGTSILSYRAFLMSVTKAKPNSACVRWITFSFHGKPPPACRWSQPTKDALSFAGPGSYLRRFIKNFANIARPLTDLLRKDAMFSWGPFQVEAFTTHHLLSASLVLGHFDHPYQRGPYRCQWPGDQSCFGPMSSQF